MIPLRILVACERSGVVRDAFRARGHDAWSCDREPSERPGPHMQCDVRDVLDEAWDLVIAHPPCTHTASSGARWFPEKRADGRQQDAIRFFMRFTELRCRWAIEHPVSIMSTVYRRPDQIIQPWQFGHGEVKATCLWLRGVPPLQPTHVVDGREPRCHREPPHPDRARRRSRTYPGIASAMADQWGAAA